MDRVVQKDSAGRVSFRETGLPRITSWTQFAALFNCDRKTLYNETVRGTVEHTRSDLSTVMEYNAEYAQNIADVLDGIMSPQFSTILLQRGVCLRRRGSSG